MEMETRFLLMERDLEDMKEELQDYKELRETVALLKQSVELLNKTVWGILACFGVTVVSVLITTVLGEF